MFVGMLTGRVGVVLVRGGRAGARPSRNHPTPNVIPAKAGISYLNDADLYDSSVTHLFRGMAGSAMFAGGTPAPP